MAGAYATPGPGAQQACDSRCNSNRAHGGNGERAQGYGNDASGRAAVRRSRADRRRWPRAGRAGGLLGNLVARADRGGNSRRKWPGAVAPGVVRTPIFNSAHCGRRGGVRHLCISAKRRAGLLAIAGTVGGRLPLQCSGSDDCPRDLCGRLDHGVDRRLSRAAPCRGDQPRCDVLPVQSPCDPGRGLAHGRDRRRRDGPCGPAVSGAGCDRTRAHAFLSRRVHADAHLLYQRRSAAAFAALACHLRGERSLRRGDAAHSQRSPTGSSAGSGDRFFQRLRRARAGRLMGDRLSDDRDPARLARRPTAAV